MKLLRNFVMFWYEFIVGDDWKLAVGVVIALVVSAALVSSGLHSIAWLLLPIMVGLALVGSLVWHVRNLNN